MSEIKVNKISPATGTETTLGDTNDKFIVPSGAELEVASGATITNAGTATNFGSSDYVLLATITGDDTADATVDVNGYYSSTYKNYRLIGSPVSCGTDSVSFAIRVMKSNAIDSTSNYVYHAGGHYLDISPSHSFVERNYSDTNNPANHWNFTADVKGNDADSPSYVDIMIYDPLHATRQKMMFARYSYLGPSGTTGGPYLTFHSNCWFKSATALSGISFYHTSGNTGGIFKLYGLK